MSEMHTGGDAVARTDAARVHALVEIARAVASTRRFDDLIDVTAAQACKALNGVAASISRWDRDEGVLRTLVNAGALGPGEALHPDDESYRVSEWPRSVALVDDSRGYLVRLTDPPSPERDLLAALGRTSALTVPIPVEGRVWGELYITRDATREPFDESDLDFAQAVAVQVAAGIVQADHFSRIERLAYQDPLTQLANRRAVDDRLELAIDEHLRLGQPLGLVLADINRLKQVNDSRGHDAGDRLICAVADAVSRAAAEAPGSLAGRIGGDEFCIVVSGGGEVARSVGERLCDMVGALPMSTGVSCGVAATDWTPAEVDTPLQLFRLADAAQYRAKRSGRRGPVLAGSPDEEPTGDDHTDRRALRSRTSVDLGVVLQQGSDALDRLGSASELERLEKVADQLSRSTAASGWWISLVPGGDRELRAVASSVYRDPTTSLPGAGDLGQVFDLDDFPVSAGAIEAGRAFVIDRGAPGNDPAEEDALAAAGYVAVLAAGGRGADCGWLVEVYADPISVPLRGLEPVARALVALALSGANGHPLPAARHQDGNVPAAL